MSGPARQRRTRMSAEERRASILDAATRVFSRGSYASATTASIAREAGITEPVLYHHFAGKAALYGACLEAAWAALRARWEAIVRDEPDSTRWLPLVAAAGFAALDDEQDAARLWLYAITDLAEDPKAKPHVVAFTTRLHEYVVELLERAQAAGGIGADLDPRAEAWIFLSIGIMRSMSRRLDGIADADMPAVLAARQAWYAASR